VVSLGCPHLPPAPLRDPFDMVPGLTISLSPAPRVPVWLWHKGREQRVLGYREIPPAVPFSRPPGAASLGGQQGAPTGAMGSRTGRTAVGQTRGISSGRNPRGRAAGGCAGVGSRILAGALAGGDPPPCRQRADFQTAHPNYTNYITSQAAPERGFPPWGSSKPREPTHGESGGRISRRQRWGERLQPPDFQVT